MVYFSNVLKYIPYHLGAPKEGNHVHAEDPTRKTDGTLYIASTSSSKYNSLNSASRVVEIISKDVKDTQHAKANDEFSFIQCTSYFKNVKILLNSIRKI